MQCEGNDLTSLRWHLLAYRLAESLVVSSSITLINPSCAKQEDLANKIRFFNRVEPYIHLFGFGLPNVMDENFLIIFIYIINISLQHLRETQRAMLFVTLITIIIFLKRNCLTRYGGVPVQEHVLTICSLFKR